jgi:hypothetical protein
LPGEKRYHDFARFILAEDQNTVQSKFFSPGVLEGCALSVSDDATLLEISAGSAITPDGVVVVNDATRSLSFLPAADPAVFTLVLVHEFDLQQGGRSSILELREIMDGGNPVFGTQVLDEDDEEEEGTVLGWINYPGGAVDLDSTMIFEAPKIRVTTPFLPAQGNVPLDYRALFMNSPGIAVIPQDSDVDQTNSLDGGTSFPISTWTNNHAATTKTLDMVLMANREAHFRPKQILIDITATHALTSMEVRINVDGSETSLDTLVGAFSSEQEVRVDDSLMTDEQALEGVSFGIRLIISIPPTQSITLKRVRVEAGPIPVEP